MEANAEKPFVSFCVSCYNQAQYLPQTLSGAFAQTYENMEIVISDDHSTDGSADVIRREIAKRQAETGGRFNVIFNVNSTNLGNLRNWNTLCRLAHGELLIKADGDDVSYPERTAKIVEAWVREGKRHDIVTHPYWRINLRGQPIGTGPARGLGCTSAYAARIYRFFGNVKCRGGFDDDIWGTRHDLLAKAGLGGGMLKLDEALVAYRSGSRLSTIGGNYAAWLERAINGDVVDALPQRLADLDFIASRLPPGEADRIRDEWMAQKASAMAQLKLLKGDTFGKRWRGFKAIRNPPSWRRLGRWIQCLLLLPPWLRNPILDTASTLRYLYLRLKYAFAPMPPLPK